MDDSNNKGAGRPRLFRLAGQVVRRILEEYKRRRHPSEGGGEIPYAEIYRELRKIAAGYVRRERTDSTVSPTELVNETYLALSANGVAFESRAHFFGVAAQIMRRILVDHASKRHSRKRGDAFPFGKFDDGLLGSDDQWALVRELDKHLEVLGKLSPRQARVVELKFFGGLTDEEIAEVLGVTVRTVKRDWEKARAWLHGTLRGQ
jgi:RNA polymerase sigma-70 factor, ECF subfamily